jgi:acyl carrier protein phosphodiesterase
LNFLGHIYLSGDNPPLQVANLYGDFFKGTHFELLPEEIAKGVHLHRAIDDFIDHHPIVHELTASLYKDLPKVSGIAVDLYFDHLLAVHWLDYHPTPLRDYSDNFFRFALDYVHNFDRENFQYSTDFIELLEIIHKGDWIYNYQFPSGLEFASIGLSRRISFPNELHQAPKVYLKHQESITSTFHTYMKDAIRHFQIG